MSKAEVLIEAITQDIIGFLIADKDIKLDEAMRLFYDSEMFDKLHEEDTGLYLEGSAYVYELYKEKCL